MHRWFPVGASTVFCFLAVSGPHIFDAGELTAAAATLGASHAPGQVLHALCGYAITLVPLGSIPFRVACLSAVATAVAIHQLMHLIALLITAWGGLDGMVIMEKTRRLSTALGVTLALSCLPFLAQSYRPEVYAAAIALWLYGARQAVEKKVPWAICVSGALATLHPAYALSLALWILVWDRRCISPSRWIPSLLSACLGLSIWIYLPLRALTRAPMWGDASTWGHFVRYISAQDYQDNITNHTGFGVIRNFADHGLYVGRSLGWVAVVLVILTLLFSHVVRKHKRAHARHDKVAAAIGAVLLPAALQPSVAYNPDNVAYTLPCVLALIALFAALMAPLMDYALQLSKRSVVNQSAIRTCVAVICLVSVAAPWLANKDAFAQLWDDIRHANALESLANAMTETPPPSALNIATSDFFSATWMQQQQVEGARPDVAVFVSGLSTSSWHWRSLKHHPCLGGGPHLAPALKPFESTHARYTRGALQRAYRCAPIAIEEFTWIPTGRAWREAERTGCPDHSLSGNVLRHHEWLNTQIYLRERRLVEATQSLRRSLCGLDGHLYDGLNLKQYDEKKLAPTVKTPSTYLESFEDMVRIAAVLSWASEQPTRSQQMLESQLTRGDSLSLIQLGWLYMSLGNRQGARVALETFEKKEPSWTKTDIVQSLRGAVLAKPILNH